MEVLKSANLTPISVFAKRSEPIKNLPLPTISPFKNQTFSSYKNTLQGGLVVLSSVLNSGWARALTYEEALQESVNTITSSSDFDINGVLANVISFASENPIIIGGGVAVLAVPLVVSQLLGKPKAWGVESAKTAYAKLGDDANAQLLDIRSAGEVKEIGGPDLKGLKKKPVGIVYKGEDKPGFLNKLASKFKEPENTTLFILDKFDGNSELVAELATENGFKSAYAIKDGAEGSRGWTKSGLPWIVPKKTLSLDLSNLTDAIGDAFGDGFEATSLAFGVAAAAGVGLLAFTEVEVILQVLGTAALIQFVSQKLLFAEDRKQTVLQIDKFLSTNIAANELVGDIQQIGKALLPLPVTSKALPAPVEATSDPTTDSTVQKSESIPPEPVPEVNSIPKPEVEEESLPVIPRPLSPYANYPDYKPPSSPIPSQP